MAEILVTGAAGFIGAHLVPRLREAGHHVVAVDRAEGDVADPATWAAFPDAAVVIHLAGRSFVPDSWREPAAYMTSNLVGTVCALDYCRARGARLVFLSSYMYGRPASLPIDERALLEARNPYALSKKLAEESCRFYADSFGASITVLRPFNVYGPGQAEPFLVPFILRQAREGREIRVKDLDPRRDYVYVRDVVDGIVAAATSPGEGFRALNIGSGVSHSVRDVIDAVQAIRGSALPVVSEQERRKDEVMDTVADIGEARRQLGWSPRFSLHEGLRDMMRTDA